MYKIGVIGDNDSIAGFRCLGMTSFIADSAEDAMKALKEIKNDDYAAVFITEKLASQIMPEIEKFSHKKTPAIIPIPGVTGNTGIGMSSLSKSVEQAVGSDILKDK